MSRREVRVLAVPKWATAAMLILVSAAMAALIYALSGRAYANGEHPILLLLSRNSVSRSTVLAVMMPVIANILLFIPWGFLAFLAIDMPLRPRRITYVLTVVGGVIFAVAIELWQFTLPTRVTTPADSLANAFGALTGAILGHLRKRVRVRFDY
jgi:glycopeptide antibiotics resistance protein